MRGILLSLCCFLFIVVPPVFAEEYPTATDAAVPLPPARTIDYPLPYPGILPDNPLYSLKTIRDKLISLLIADPFKRAEFDLLQADKRLQAGVYLLRKDKKYTPLAITTIGKGENYFAEAISMTVQARQQGFQIEQLVQKLTDASATHQRVLVQLARVIPVAEQGGIHAEIQRVAKMQQEVNKIIPKKQHQ